MKVTLVLLIACLAFVCADTDLPPNIGSVSELATVLANEPASAARFAEAASASDVVSFREEDNCGNSCGGSAPQTTTTFSSEEGSEDDAEFDGQINQIDEDLKRLKEQIKESEECSRRLSEQKAEVESLSEQKEHLLKEKEKAKLQRRLDKQMKDLSEINRMSRSLRQKFNELKHTQKIIKSKVQGTRSSLNQLDAEPETTLSDVTSAPDTIGSEMDAMQEAQEAILKQAHELSGRDVRDAIKLSNKVALAGKSHDREQQH